MSASSRRTLGALAAALLLCGGIAVARELLFSTDRESEGPAAKLSANKQSLTLEAMGKARRRVIWTAIQNPESDTAEAEPQPDVVGPREPRSQRAPVECGGDVLCEVEIEAIVRRAAAAVESSTMTVAVSDRIGNILALFRQPGAPDGNDDLAVGLARTAAFFSNNAAPLSSRTVRFISGVHFPPGIRNTPNAALYGIENTNRGCDFNVDFIPGQELPQPRSVIGVLYDVPCNAFSQLGCGLGIVTGKVQPFDEDPTAVNPGGVPIFRPRNPLDPGDGPAISMAQVLGGIGVAGGAPSATEYAAFQGAFGDGTTAPVPQFPLDPPGNVFIEGIRLPFVNQVSRPGGFGPGDSAGNFILDPTAGRKDPEGYLVAPRAGQILSAEDVKRIVEQSFQTAARTRAVIRLPLGSRASMAIAVADLNGEILALYRMKDSTIFSIDVAVAKSRNVVYFSGSPDAPNDLPGVPVGTAVTNRTISYGSQPFFPPGIDSSSPGPFFDLFLSDLENPCSQGRQTANFNQTGVVFFPGSIPLYSGSVLIGGLGISGDGVEQDDYVSFFGAEGFRPPEDIWANTVFVRGVRLPFLKFPRNPEE